MLKSLKGVYDFGLLTLELLVPGNTMLSYLKTTQNILMTFLAGSQVSHRCPLVYLFVLVFLDRKKIMAASLLAVE